MSSRTLPPRSLPLLPACGPSSSLSLVCSCSSLLLLAKLAWVLPLLFRKAPFPLLFLAGMLVFPVFACASCVAVFSISFSSARTTSRAFVNLDCCSWSCRTSTSNAGGSMVGMLCGVLYESYDSGTSWLQKCTPCHPWSTFNREQTDSTQRCWTSCHSTSGLFTACTCLLPFFLSFLPSPPLPSFYPMVSKPIYRRYAHLWTTGFFGGNQLTPCHVASSSFLGAADRI